MSRGSNVGWRGCRACCLGLAMLSLIASSACGSGGSSKVRDAVDQAADEDVADATDGAGDIGRGEDLPEPDLKEASGDEGGDGDGGGDAGDAAAEADDGGEVCEGDGCGLPPLVCAAGEFSTVDGVCLLCDETGTGYAGEGEPVSDGNDCTTDACDAQAGLSHVPFEGPCDDGNPATTGDTCIAGACAGQLVVCQAGTFGLVDALCVNCLEDGTGYEAGGTVVDDENACTDDICDPAVGVVHENNSDPCSDGDLSTGDDTCAGGVCVGTPVVCMAGEFLEDNGKCPLCNEAGTGYQSEGGQVDDSNVCTADACEALIGVLHTFVEGPCDDGDPLTAGDACEDGLCAGNPLVCPPGDFFVEGGQCTLCNAEGTAAAGEGAPIDDGNACTDDVCDPEAGLSHAFNTATCDDGNAQTGNDKCGNGTCKGTPIVCQAGKWVADSGKCAKCNADGTGYVGDKVAIDDGNPCTSDGCDAGTGVFHQAAAGPCDDANPGTAEDQCTAGKCVGIPVVCAAGKHYLEQGTCKKCNSSGTGSTGAGAPVDDGNVCTDDKCDPALGAQHFFNKLPCDDGKPDTFNDACSGGVCTGVEVLCEPGDWFIWKGLCYLCNGDGDGVTGEGTQMDDGNVCTQDKCDKGLGVIHKHISGPCDDGNAQTVNDHCSGGACKGDPKICEPGLWVVEANGWWCQQCNAIGNDWVDDGLPTSDKEDCTKDVCDPVQGVIHLPQEGICWDENKCTLDDVCVNAKCTGTPLACDDMTVCTTDTCDPAAGCVFTVTAATCDDGLAATPDDVCVGSVCVGDLDPDNDGIPNHGSGPPCDGPGLLAGCVDNCPYLANAGQVDGNNDGIGDACQEPRVWVRVKTGQKVVALTFDDGWDELALVAILKALDAGPAYGSFFLLGQHVAAGDLEPETLAMVRNAGHVLGNHTYDHSVGTDTASCVQEMLLAEQAYADVGAGSIRPLFRLPSPNVTQPQVWVYPAMKQVGYTDLVLANFDVGDWHEVEPPLDGMVQCVLDQVQPGDIVSLHVGPAVTPLALPAIIEGLEAKGYLMLSAEQIMAYGPPEFLWDASQIKTCENYF